MGKKPVIGLIGLVWAGIALTGCGECCRNTRNTYQPKSTWQTKEDTGMPKAPPAGDPRSTGELPPAKPPVTNPPMSKIDDGRVPLSSAPTGMEMSKFAAPTEAKALRTPMDVAPAAPVMRTSDVRMRETTTAPSMSRDTNAVNIPRPPVMRSTATPSEGLKPIDPPTSSKSSLPLPSEAASSTEPAPLPPVPSGGAAAPPFLPSK